MNTKRLPDRGSAFRAGFSKLWATIAAGWLLTSAALTADIHPGEMGFEFFLQGCQTNSEVTSLVAKVKRDSAAITALGKDGGKEAQMALLRIAYGELGGRLSIRAASTYISTLSNRVDLRALLIAPDNGVCALALARMAHMGPGPPDEVTFKLLLGVLRRDDTRVRELASAVIGAAAGQDLWEAAARAVVDSMKTTLTLKDAQNSVNAPGYGCVLTWKHADIFLAGQAKALGRMKWVPAAWLRQESQSAKGLVRDYLMVARGFAGDSEAKPELRRILKESVSARLRLSAAEAFGEMARWDDLSFMELIAAEDPFSARVSQVIPDHAVKIGDEWHLYPVREAMKLAIKRMTAKP